MVFAFAKSLRQFRWLRFRVRVAPNWSKIAEKVAKMSPNIEFPGRTSKTSNIATPIGQIVAKISR